MSTVLDDPEIKALLMDEEIVKFLSLLREHPMKAQ